MIRSVLWTNITLLQKRLDKLLMFSRCELNVSHLRHYNAYTYQKTHVTILHKHFPSNFRCRNATSMSNNHQTLKNDLGEKSVEVTSPEEDCDEQTEIDYRRSSQLNAVLSRYIDVLSSSEGFLSDEQCVSMRSECQRCLSSSGAGDSTRPCVSAPSYTAQIVERVVDGRILQALVSFKPTSPTTTPPPGSDSAIGGSSDREIRAALLVAFSYVHFLNKTGSFNPASVLITAQILYKLCKNKQVDESYILHFYDNVLQAKFGNFLKLSPMSKLYCLAPTSRWPEALDVLKSLRSRDSATSHFLAASCMIDRGETERALELIRQAVQVGDMAMPETAWQTLEFHRSMLNYILELAAHPTNAVANKKKALHYFKQYVDLLRCALIMGVPVQFEGTIRQIFQSFGKRWKVVRSQVVDERCTSCFQTMESEEISGEEFEKMKQDVMNELIQGKDIFRCSTPQEMKRFLNFVEYNKPFDVVFDTLNLAFCGHGRKLSSQERPKRVASIVKNFQVLLKARKMCLLARKHFFQNNPAELAHLSRIASVFLLGDTSYDDPFILYSALSSGKDCYIVSNDVYGFLESTLYPKVRSLFVRWKRTRLLFDYSVNAQGVPQIVVPPKFSIRPQCEKGRFHIPLIERKRGSEKEKGIESFAPIGWLCIWATT